MARTGWCEDVIHRAGFTVGERYVESFNGKLRHKLLAREAFDTLLDAKVLIELWRHHCNTIRPHSALAHRPPAPEARQPCAVASATPRQPHRAGGRRSSH
jgi:transposase InsO family protein